MSAATIIHGTPAWVWVLLLFLLSRGWSALSSRTVPLSRLAIIPLIFTGWGIVHLALNPLAGWSTVIVWVTASLVGVVAGAFIAGKSRFVVDPVANTVLVPGSALPLILMISIFAVRFWLGFHMATAIDSSLVGVYVVIGAAVSGIVAGVFCGRFITYWRAIAARRVMQAC